MTTSLSTSAALSFAQWLDHYLLQNAQAYINTTTRLFYQDDPSLGTGFITYATPFRSLVYDSGVNGAVIFNAISGYFFNASAYTSSGSGNLYSGMIFPQIDATGGGYLPLEIDFGTGAYVSLVSGYGVQSGNKIFFTDSMAQTGVVRVSGSGDGTYYDVPFTIDGQPVVINRGQFGMVTDFINGRAIFPSNAISTNVIFSGSYAFKDYNIYFANQWANPVVFTNKYYLNSRFNRPITGIPPPGDMVTPAIFVSPDGYRNDDFALGGLYSTKIDITLNIYTESLSQLAGIMSFMSDAKDLAFPQLDSTYWPLNSFGDYKSGYNYSTLFQQFNTPSNLFSITNVQCSKLSDAVKVDDDIFMGVVHVTTQRVRTIV